MSSVRTQLPTARACRDNPRETTVTIRLRPPAPYSHAGSEDFDDSTVLEVGSMRVNQTVQVCVLAAALLLPSAGAASATFKLCGRKLGEIMSRVCHVYNSPSWDVPTVVEQPASMVRRKRQAGIADECCTYGCTWAQLSEYCSISANSEAILEGLEAHMIADRSAEQDSQPVTSPQAVASEELRRSRSREVGAGSGNARRRGRRCRCRRKRRLGRRRSDLMGNMALIKNVVRAAPVVGTVSPLVTWGRTLNTNLPPSERDRYAYVAVYST